MLRERLQARGLLDVAESIAARHHLSVEQIADKSRFKSITEARREIFAALSDAGLSSTEIGYLFDRDHTTVLSAIGRITLAPSPTLSDSVCPECHQTIEWREPTGFPRRTFAVGTCGCQGKSWSLRVTSRMESR